jgi:hypothetical protein
MKTNTRAVDSATTFPLPTRASKDDLRSLAIAVIRQAEDNAGHTFSKSSRRKNIATVAKMMGSQMFAGRSARKPVVVSAQEYEDFLVQ